MPSDGRSSLYGVYVLHAAIAFGAFCAGLATLGAIRPLFAVLALLPLLVVIGIGVALPASGVFARVVHRGVSGRREIALTFDDGPDARWTPTILDVLDARQQRGTFFVIGQRAASEPELLREIVSRGHEIANHTWSHSYLTPFMPPARLAEELVRTNATIEKATGRRPKWFRPPVGLLSPRVVAGVKRVALETVCWTATARDGVARTTVKEGVDRLIPSLVPGAILVLHDARLSGDQEPVAVQILTQLLDRMETLGLRSVTLSELCA